MLIASIIIHVISGITIITLTISLFHSERKLAKYRDSWVYRIKNK